VLFVQLVITHIQIIVLLFTFLHLIVLVLHVQHLVLMTQLFLHFAMTAPSSVPILCSNLERRWSTSVELVRDP
jgi:hypothetical protein